MTTLTTLHFMGVNSMADADSTIRRRDFTNARSNARRRGIEWSLDFDTWAAAWIESGRYSMRGKLRGQYQMDRIDNSRGYEPGNIQIIDGRRNRIKDAPHGWSPKLTPDAVADIRSNFKKCVRGWSYFAAKYSVSVASIKAVRTGRNWKGDTPMPVRCEA